MSSAEWWHFCLGLNVLSSRTGAAQWWISSNPVHYNDVIMIAIASKITNLTIVYSTVHPGADKRKHQSSASPAFARGIHRWPVNSPHKWPVTRKMFPFDDVIMRYKHAGPAHGTQIPAETGFPYDTSPNIPSKRSDAVIISLKIRINALCISWSLYEWVGCWNAFRNSVLLLKYAPKLNCTSTKWPCDFVIRVSFTKMIITVWISLEFVPTGPLDNKS